MNQYKVDFHIHTNYSDGQASPAAIVKKAKELDYDMIAITDHDGVEGVKQAIIAGEAAGIKVIPGIEFAAETREGIGVHILGYYINPENMQLNMVTKELQKLRNDRNKRLIEVLQDMGYDISMEDLKERQPNNYIGKPVIARVLAEKGYISSPEEAFKAGKFLESKEAAAVKREKIGADDAIAVIEDAGGIAVLAHPVQIKGIGERDSDEFYLNLEKILADLKWVGLKGIECYHPDQNHEQTMKFVELAEKYHMHITKGSDFHGKDFAEAEPTA